MMCFANFFQPITANMFAAIGKPIKSVFLSLTRQVIFFIPMLLILPRFFGFNGVLYSGPVADIAALIATFLMAVLEFRDMRRRERENR